MWLFQPIVMDAVIMLPEKMLMAASDYIGASGEDTTHQLTPPSGKSYSDFQAGRIQDDENPADSIDLGSGKYTELEWCIKALDAVVTDEVYQFRISRVGAGVLDTYSVTPQWTIGTGGAPEVSPVMQLNGFWGPI